MRMASDILTDSRFIWKVIGMGQEMTFSNYYLALEALKGHLLGGETHASMWCESVGSESEIALDFNVVAHNMLREAIVKTKSKSFVARHLGITRQGLNQMLRDGYSVKSIYIEKLADLLGLRFRLEGDEVVLQSVIKRHDLKLDIG